MPKLNWEDAESIGIELYEAHPDVDPLTVRFTDMHAWILQLADFAGEADKSNEAKLEAIQMAWYEEWKDNQ
jgi:FeS assembly protein IscX